jgi:alkanesulfonate monooxygenase SsuD/methylene tetrahydromethanopterin reductase-like flavin-dependent oxidoreductase (luciferase family)
MIQALRVLWSDEHASFHGRYYSFDDVDLLPKPIQQPCPIYIAGTPRATSIGERGVERSLRRIARYADGWMTNQIELPLLQDYLKRLREMLVEEGRDPEKFKTVLYYGISVNRNPSKPFAKPRPFLTRITSRTFHEKGWKSGLPAGRSSIVSAPFKISSTLEWITSPFDPSAKTSTSNSGFICKKSSRP